MHCRAGESKDEISAADVLVKIADAAAARFLKNRKSVSCTPTPAGEWLGNAKSWAKN